MSSTTSSNDGRKTPDEQKGDSDASFRVASMLSQSSMRFMSFMDKLSASKASNPTTDDSSSEPSNVEKKVDSGSTVKATGEIDKKDTASPMSFFSSMSTALFSKSKDISVDDLINSTRSISGMDKISTTGSIFDIVNVILENYDQLKRIMNRHFGEVETGTMDMSRIFYFLEMEEECKTPSWKRRQHLFMNPVGVEELFALHHPLYLASLTYGCSIESLKTSLRNAGKHEYELLYCQFESKPGQPSHYVALDKQRKSSELQVTVVVRGTKSVHDCITDCLMDSVPYDDGLAHSGMLEAGKWLSERHMHLLEELRTVAGVKTIHVSLIGHSMGAGAAAVAARELRKKPGISASSLGFGCPGLLSETLSLECASYITTVVCDNDCFPRMSAATLSNILVDILAFDWSDRAIRDIKFSADTAHKSASTNVTGRLAINVFKNLVDKDALFSKANETVRRVAKPSEKMVSKKDIRLDVDLYPPGRVIHLYRDGRGISLSEAPCTFFNEIDVSRTMLDDHLITGHDKLFLEVLRNHTGNQTANFENIIE